MANARSSHRHDEMPKLAPGPDGHRHCTECGRVIYSDPKLATAAIIPSEGGIVLVRRAIEPALGEWSFPSGYVNRGEEVESAMRREVLEETRLEVRVGWLVGLYSRADDPVVLSVYHAEIAGGRLAAGDETSEAAIFPVDALPDLAFEHDDRIMRDWQAGLRLRGLSAG